MTIDDLPVVTRIRKTVVRDRFRRAYYIVVVVTTVLSYRLGRRGVPCRGVRVNAGRRDA